MKQPTSSPDPLATGDKILAGAIIAVVISLVVMLVFFFRWQSGVRPAISPTATPDPLLLAIPTKAADELTEFVLPTSDPAVNPTHTPHPTPRMQVLSSNPRYITIIDNQLWFITNGQKFNTVEVRFVELDSNRTIQAGELETVDETAVLAAVTGENKLFVSQLPNQTATMKVWQLTAGVEAPPEHEPALQLTPYQSATQTTLGNLTLLAQADDNGDVELWRKEGNNPAELLLNLNDVASSNPQNFIVFKERVYFTATDRHNDTELWYTDGTAEGTSRLKDVNPSFSSAPSDFVVFGNYLYFVADDWNNGRELWRTDGTPENTLLFANISR